MAATQSYTYKGQGFSPRGDKARYVLPPLIRKTVRESSDGRVLCLAKHEKFACLVGFGTSRETEFEDQLDREEQIALSRNEPFDRDTRAAQLYGYSEVPFDESGRFVIPEHLSGLANIDGPLFFQGLGRSFTLWNPTELAKVPSGWEAAQAACASMVRDAAAGGRGRK